MEEQKKRRIRHPKKVHVEAEQKTEQNEEEKMHYVLDVHNSEVKGLNKLGG
jgi:hypothetical protein